MSVGSNVLTDEISVGTAHVRLALELLDAVRTSDVPRRIRDLVLVACQVPSKLQSAVVGAGEAEAPPDEFIGAKNGLLLIHL